MTGKPSVPRPGLSDRMHQLGVERNMAAPPAPPVVVGMARADDGSCRTICRTFCRTVGPAEFRASGPMLPESPLVQMDLGA